MVRFVTINKFCELTGYTRRAVEGKRQDGVWTEGCVIVKAPDGHILIDMEEFNKWAASGRESLKFPAAPMKSPSPIKVSAAASGLKRNPPLPIFER